MPFFLLVGEEGDEEYVDGEFIARENVEDAAKELRDTSWRIVEGATIKSFILPDDEDQED